MSSQQPSDNPPRPTDQELLAYVTQLEDATRIARRRAWWRLALGLVIAAVAGLISLATYGAAEQQATQTGSGTYYVWWGPMALGGWMALTAAVRLWRLR